MIIAVLLLIFSISIGFYIYVKVNFNKYKTIKLKNNMSGFEVARKILDNHDLNNVYITESKSRVISSYDIDRKVIRLTNGVFNDESLTSAVISSKVASHAIQDKKNDKAFQIREKLINFINVLLIVGYIVTLFGCFFGHVNTIIIGLALIDLIIFFHFAFYNIDKKAIRIALVELINSKIISKSEYKKIEKLLSVYSYINISSIIFPVALLIRKIFIFGDSNK